MNYTRCETQIRSNRIPPPVITTTDDQVRVRVTADLRNIPMREAELARLKMLNVEGDVVGGGSEQQEA